jgi:predicted DNA binding CopG/RHH family protein
VSEKRMDTLNPFGTDYLDDPSWLDTTMPEMPALSPEEEAMLALVQSAAKAMVEAKARRRASRRKAEVPVTSASEKITIRMPRPLLRLLREQAALAGMPYQTYIKTMLYNVATR